MSINKYNDQLQVANHTTITNLDTVAKRIRDYLISQGIIPSASNTLWQGNIRQNQMTLVSMDILIVNQQAISVKQDSNLVHNASPDIVFNKIPLGQLGQKGIKLDWFQQTANLEFDNYYTTCKQELQSQNSTIFQLLPSLQNCGNTRSYYRQTKGKASRKLFSKEVRILHELQQNSTVLTAYQVFCDKVSQESSRIFNQNIQKLIGSVRSAHSALSPIFQYFFRVNSTQYILCGLESRQPFAIIVPSGSSWTQQYDFNSIQASPIVAGQPEVRLSFSLRHKQSQRAYTINMRVEIRWSHGKFCGNPEAKVYKDFSYTSLPWVTIL